MKLHFASLLGILFPHTNDELLLQGVTVDAFAQKYSPHTHAECTALAYFTDPQVRASLHLCKFHNNQHALQLASSLCALHFSHLPQQEYLLLPIPLSPQRERTRGYNQSENIARAASKAYPHIHLLRGVLIRTKHTKPQTSLTKKERVSNMHAAFLVPQEKYPLLTNKHVLILDDVTTTGATLRAAKEAVRKAQPLSVTTIAIAH